MSSELEMVVGGHVERMRRAGAEPSDIETKAAAGGLPRSVGDSLSAFANGSGGVLILGLSEDAGFTPAPGFSPGPVRDALAGLCSDGMEPPIRGDIEIVPFENATVVYLEVPPLDPVQRPCYVKSKGAYGGSFIRAGDGDRRLTAYEVDQLLSNRSQPTADTEPVLEATVDDLDPDKVAALLRRLRATPSRAFTDVPHEVALRRVGAVRVGSDGDHHPTLAGLLCLGTYPQQFFPQLFVSFVALPGRSLGDSLDDGTRFLDNVTCDGTIPEMLDSVLTAARRNMRTAAIIHGTGREDRYDYPTEVIRELVVNALLHRDYSASARGTQVQVELYPDRLAVKSPGGLFGNVVPGQLGVEEVSSTRNALLARLLTLLPHTDGMPVSENRGSGLSSVMTRLRRAGMSPPRFDAAPGHLHVTVPQHALLDPPTIEWIGTLSASNLSNDQHIALALMRGAGSVSNEMLRAWGVEAHAATTALRGLVDAGLATKHGGRRYASYELSELEEEPEDWLFGGILRPAETAAPPPLEPTEAPLEAVLQCIRAGSITVKTISESLGLSIATVTRRINILLESGRIRQSARPHSRGRSFSVVTDDGED